LQKGHEVGRSDSRTLAGVLVEFPQGAFVSIDESFERYQVLQLCVDGVGELAPVWAGSGHRHSSAKGLS
jgi:hypothetical protein